MTQFYEGLINPASNPTTGQQNKNNNGRQAYYNTITMVNSTQSLKADCAEILFYNQGTSNVTINNALQLANKDFVSFDAEENELDITVYDITFDNTGSNKLVIIRKNYTTAT